MTPLRFFAALVLFATQSAHAKFDISLEKRCYGGSTNNYFFTGAHTSPNYNVKVGASVYPFDIAFELVNKKRDADLVFIENKFDGNEITIQFSNNSDLQVCRKLSPVGAQIIQVSTNSPDAELTVKLGKYVINKDYKLFVESSRVRPEQAAALFAIMWKNDRARFLSMLE